MNSGVQLLVANKDAGTVIGRSGATIQTIQQKTGCRVRVSNNGDYYPGTNDRVVLVTGTTEAVAQGVGLVVSELYENAEEIQKNGGRTVDTVMLSMLVPEKVYYIWRDKRFSEMAYPDIGEKETVHIRYVIAEIVGAVLTNIYGAGLGADHRSGRREHQRDGREERFKDSAHCQGKADSGSRRARLDLLWQRASGLAPVKVSSVCSNSRIAVPAISFCQTTPIVMLIWFVFYLR
jgi:hypothetical protein